MDLSLFYSDDLLFFTFFFYLLCALIQLLFLWLVFGKLAFYRQKHAENQSIEPVSVVLCGKEIHPGREEHLLRILAQDHPDFEVIIVNESPDEEQKLYLETLTQRYPRLKIVNIGENLNFFRGRKFPLSIGIKSAGHDIIVLTDIDCMPAGDHWLSKIQAAFRPGTEIVLGYSTLLPQKGMLNSWIRFDSMLRGIRYLSFALAGEPYMGIGENLAYRKSLFYKVHGFTSHYKLMTGDDDLFINKVAGKNNTAIETETAGQVLCTGWTTFGAWLLQRKQHIETQVYFKRRHKILLGLNYLSLLLFYLTFLFLLRYPAVLITVLIIFGIRLFSFMFIIKKSMRKLNEKNLLLLSPFYELFLMLVFAVLKVSVIFARTNKWK